MNTKCFVCEKDLECEIEHGVVYHGGTMLLDFGYGSSHDSGLFGDADFQVEAYLCDDCFTKKKHLCNGFKLIKSVERRLIYDGANYKRQVDGSTQEPQLG